MRTRRKAVRPRSRRSPGAIGIEWGAVLATAYSVFALVYFIVKGGGLFAERGISLGATIGTYYALGLLGGWVVGHFLSAATTWQRRLGLSLYVGVLVSGGLYVVIAGWPWTWNRVFLGAFATFASVITGFMMWSWSAFFSE